MKLIKHSQVAGIAAQRYPLFGHLGVAARLGATSLFEGVAIERVTDGFDKLLVLARLRVRSLFGIFSGRLTLHGLYFSLGGLFAFSLLASIFAFLFRGGLDWHYFCLFVRDLLPLVSRGTRLEV